MPLPRLIRTREHLLAYAATGCPSKAAERALAGRNVTVLGGFSSVPPSWLPGWVCKIESGRGSTWYVAVVVNRDGNGYAAFPIDKVPWDVYVGTKDMPLHRGDDPKYAEFRHRMATRTKA